MNPPQVSSLIEKLRAWTGPLLLAGVFASLAGWSWRKWPDLLVDFGRELYIPWQLAQGQVLYRDIALNYGPFPQYLNALAFQCFGVSFTTLIFCNLAVLAGVTWLIYQALVRACDRLTAFIACLILLLLFAFPQYAAIGSMNFVAPYSHAATHGFAWSVAMLACLGRGGGRRPGLTAAGAGLCFGFVFLTKPEIFLAALLAALAWAGILLLSPRTTRSDVIKLLGYFILGASLPALGFLIYFATRMPLEPAARSVLGAWRYAFNPELSRNYYYGFGIGLDDLRGNSILMAKMFGGIVGLVGLATAVDLVAAKRKANPWVVASLLGLALGAGFWKKPDFIPWLQIPRGLPLVTLAAGFGFGIHLLRQRKNPEPADRFGSLLMWSAFAFGLLGKMLFNVRFSHYGFYLALPATLILVVALVWFWPLLLKRRAGGGELFRVLALILLALGTIYYFRISQEFYAWKNFPIGAKGDLIFGYNPEVHPRDDQTALALKWIEERVPATATLVVMPEGTMLNYLSRRHNPTPYIYFTMVEMISFGESNLLAAFQAHPPDYVVLVHVSSEDYGVGFFGQDPRYGRGIMEWVRNNYDPVARIGAEPLQTELFGIKIFQRRLGG